MSVGLIVDTVTEVIYIPEGNIEPAPTINNKTGSRYIKCLVKVSEEVKILLDTHKLLFGEEGEQRTESMAA